MGRLLNRSVCIRLLEVIALTIWMKLTKAIAPERALPVNLLGLHLRINIVAVSPAKVFTAVCVRACVVCIYT